MKCGPPCQSSGQYDFPDFDENAKATTFYTDRNHRVGDALATGSWFSTPTLCVMGSVGGFSMGGGVSEDDVYMPLTPMFHVHAWGLPYVSTVLGLDGSTRADTYGQYSKPHKDGKGHFLSLRADYPAHALELPGRFSDRPFQMESNHRRLGASQRAVQGGHGEGHKPLCRLWHVRDLSDSLTVVTKPHMVDLSDEREVDFRCRAGITAPLVELQIIDPQGNQLPHDNISVGEVVARTPGLPRGTSGRWSVPRNCGSAGICTLRT